MGENKEKKKELPNIKIPLWLLDFRPPQLDSPASLAYCAAKAAEYMLKELQRYRNIEKKFQLKNIN